MRTQYFVALALLAGLGLTPAHAQTKEVTIAHQDMIVPFRVAMAAGAVEKATGYKIDWKMFGGGGDVIKAMASGQIPLGEVARRRRPRRRRKASTFRSFGSWTTSITLSNWS